MSRLFPHLLPSPLCHNITDERGPTVKFRPPPDSHKLQVACQPEFPEFST